MRFIKWRIRGWTLILSVALGYELIAFVNELRGIHDYPTLSTIIVTLFALQPVLLDVLTVAVAVALVWHWHGLKRKLQALTMAVRREMKRAWDMSGYEDGDEQYDWVTHDKR